MNKQLTVAGRPFFSCRFIPYRFLAYCRTTGHCERLALLDFKRFSLARALHKLGLPPILP
jgi:hypothetical protein